MKSKRMNEDQVIEYYHLTRKDAEVLDHPADLYETESRYATIGEVKKLGKEFEKLIQSGIGVIAMLRGPTNWGVARTVLSQLDAVKYRYVVMWYPKLQEWQMSEAGAVVAYRVPADKVKIAGE
jgi:hypothetical protein